MLADVLFTIGAILMATAKSIPLLIFGRLIVGFGVGAASLVVPVYLSEVSPVEVRGTVVAVDVMVITGG
jgi:SP family myo-inositol transporter-like MFS transporter 13